jgi:sulfotransferase family protein
MPTVSTSIAMWSGPRNISTALMRAFENRRDTEVIDEPFYAYYLQETGLDHPMRQEVLKSQSVLGDEIIKGLVAKRTQEYPVFYQKHMTQHMLPGLDLTWLGNVTNCFLIRSPKEIVASYAQKRQDPTDDDIGLKRQFELFERVKEITGKTPPVLDSNEVLMDPKTNLTKLCKAVGIEFSDEMLSWPKGRRSSDGVWAGHWYQNVEASTGFAPFVERELKLPAPLQQIAERGQGYYEALKAEAL